MSGSNSSLVNYIKVKTEDNVLMAHILLTSQRIPFSFANINVIHNFRIQ